MKVRVLVTPKKNVLDPQGVAVQQAISHMGFEAVAGARVGKVIELELTEDPALHTDKLHEICRDLLSNPVVEDYELEVLSASTTSPASA
jgi:phosphoribosylformylglycinamidine synthase